MKKYTGIEIPTETITPCHEFHSAKAFVVKVGDLYYRIERKAKLLHEKDAKAGSWPFGWMYRFEAVQIESPERELDFALQQFIGERLAQGLMAGDLTDFTCQGSAGAKKGGWS
ncbi:MAG: hypothetical protein JWO73_914 [Candidatus Taylorbacteria bacterium]|nr:hypothetical protein [Candidatus Taylorbacteria bacterium]